MKILVVDDYEMIQRLLVQSLDELGIENVMTASNGEEAIKLIQNSVAEGAPFELIFLDWNMPHMSGLDVVRVCKADPRISSIPIIMISAERNMTQIKEALSLGVTEYVIKPFSSKALASKIEKLMEKHKIAN